MTHQMYRINARNACQPDNLNKQPQMCDPKSPWKFNPPFGFDPEVGLNADQLAKVWVDATSDMDGAAALPFDLNEKMVSCQTNIDCPGDRPYCLYGFCNKNNTCTCAYTHTGSDCSLRTCAKGVAWTDYASATDTAHAYAECSNTPKIVYFFKNMKTRCDFCGGDD